MGMTIYGCAPDEAELFHALAPGFGVRPTITQAAVSEANIELALGNRCVSVGHRARIPNGILLALGRAGVRYICTRSIGCDHIDVSYAERIGITVGTVAYSPDSVADYTLMLMLMLLRNAKSVIRRVDAHDYRLSDARGKELRDLTVGVVGTGRIGAAVIRRLQGFGARVLAHDRSPHGRRSITSPLTELLEQSDVVTLHTPLNADTHHLLDRRRIAHLKRGAFVINTGRGALLETEALLQALEDGRLGGAALDVLEGEEGIFYADRSESPLESPVLLRLQQLPNVVISPHAAYFTAHALERHRRKHDHQLPCVRKGDGVDRLKVGIVFGGCSEEHPISVKSAQEVARNLDVEKYEPFYIGITMSGAWKLCDGPETDWEAGNCRPAVLSPDRSVHGLLVLEPGTVRDDPLGRGVSRAARQARRGRRDAGPVGALRHPLRGLRCARAPRCAWTNPWPTSSRAMPESPPRTTGLVLANETLDPDRLTYPVFVKPARSGSSFGVSKVSCPEELPGAVQIARQYDSKVLIEDAVVASEVGCAILGERFGLVAGEVDRISLSHGFFRIHQETNPESGSENSTPIVPADISAESRALVQETAKAIYRALGCRGLARVDMFLKEDGTVVLNEVNTLPGMTSYSRYPRMMAAAGLSLAELIDRMVSLTLNGKRR